MLTQLQFKRKWASSGHFWHKLCPIALADKSNHRPNVAIWHFGRKLHIITLRKLHVPELTKHNLFFLSSSVPGCHVSPSHSLGPPTPTPLCSVSVFVEEPFGEFSSRRMLQNEKKLLTQAKALLERYKDVSVTREIKNLTTPTHRPYSPIDTCGIILVIF